MVAPRQLKRQRRPGAAHITVYAPRGEILEILDRDVHERALDAARRERQRREGADAAS